MRHIPYKSRVELSAAPQVLRLPVDVGGTREVADGVRGFVASHGFGLTAYVIWADGSEGPCPVDWLKVLP